MRGGALIHIAWGTLLTVFLIGCWLWTNDALQVGEFGFAAVVTFGGAAFAIARGRREALRPGEPRPVPGPEAVPSSSLGAVLVAIAFASILFGFTFGRFLIFFGGGLLVASLGVVALELRQQHRAVRAWSRREGAAR